MAATGKFRKGGTMSNLGRSGRLGSFIAMVVLVGACSGPESSPSPSPSIPPERSATGTTAPATAPSVGQRLLVLAVGRDGQAGLWALGPGERWSVVAPEPGATALGRSPDGVVLASGGRIENRSGPGLSESAGSTALKWPGGAPPAPIVAVDVSAAGEIALATADESRVGFALAGADGTVTALMPAPTQPFTPFVAWLDGSRLVVLSTDNREVSRLAIVDSIAHSIEPAAALAGVRVAAASADGKTIAAATGTGIYAGPLSTFQGTSAPAPINSLGPAQVVWAPALDFGGSRLSVLSGTVAPDGTVGSIHEIGYELEGSGWTKVLDVEVPFARGIGQVYQP